MQDAGRASLTDGNNLRNDKVAANQNAHHDSRRRIYKLQVHPSRMAKFSVLKMSEYKRVQQDYIITTNHIECKLQVNPSRMAKFSVPNISGYMRMQKDYLITTRQTVQVAKVNPFIDGNKYETQVRTMHKSLNEVDGRLRNAFVNRNH